MFLQAILKEVVSKVEKELADPAVQKLLESLAGDLGVKAEDLAKAFLKLVEAKLL
jgi:hypothetical protein